MDAAVLEGGFADQARGAAAAFRAIMRAMARPGRIETASGAMPPAPLSVAAGTLLLTLADPETPVYLAGGVDTPEVRGWLAFHTGAPPAERDRAVFAVGRWEHLTPLEPYRIGTADYPDRSATLIIECDRLTSEGTRLTGPGIRAQAHLPLPDPEAFARNRARYPLGLDFYLTCSDQIAGLPRSTRIG